jgi:predicted alpha/beta-hydrolase family hydrolase
MLVNGPATPDFVYVLAHGAGAGMRHPFLETVARKLADRNAATVRYDFPYMAAGKSRVDSPAVATAAVREAVAEAAKRFPGVALVAGGKSFGGRMTSQAQADQPMPSVAGLAFLGFPLHPPGKQGIERADHLKEVKIPMLFLQGTRDTFAELALLQQVVKALGKRATLTLIEGGDHSFKAPKSAGSPDEIMSRLCDTICTWAKELKR